MDSIRVRGKIMAIAKKKMVLIRNKMAKESHFFLDYVAPYGKEVSTYRCKTACVL